MAKRTSRAFKAAGRRNFNIGRLKGVGVNIKGLISELSHQLSPSQADDLRQAKITISRVAEQLARKYYRSNL